MRIQSHHATQIERAAAGVLDDEDWRGKRFVRWLVWGVAGVSFLWLALIALLYEWGRSLSP